MGMFRISFLSDRKGEIVIEFVWLDVQPGPEYAFESELGLGSLKPWECLVRRERWKADGSGINLTDDSFCLVTLVVTIVEP